MEPVVRYMLLCDAVTVDPDRPLCVQIDCLMIAIRSHEEPPFPLLRESICVLLVLTECRGQGVGEIRVVCLDDATDTPVFGSPPRQLAFAGESPLETIGVSFVLRDCLFPKAGRYAVQFWYNGRSISEQALLLR